MLHCPRAALKALKDLLVHRPKECVRNYLPVYIYMRCTSDCSLSHNWSDVNSYLSRYRTEPNNAICNHSVVETENHNEDAAQNTDSWIRKFRLGSIPRIPTSPSHKDRPPGMDLDSNV